MRIQLELTPRGINRAIKELRRFEGDFEAGYDLFVERLQQEGFERANYYFSAATYDGTNDVYVSIQKTGDGFYIWAQGEAVCFIEYGAGVYWANQFDYPGERKPPVAGIGQYGKGNGMKEYWFYRGDPGTNGVMSTKKPGMVITHGNPPNAPMYYTAQHLKESIEQILKEIWT